MANNVVINVNANTANAVSGLNGISTAIRDAQGRWRDAQGRFVSSGNAITGALGGVTTAAQGAAGALGTGGAGGGGLSGALGGVGVVAAMSALPAIGALIPMMAGVVLASQTLKLGFAGVGDAMELAGKDAKAYQEALDKMGPEQREFTETLVDLKDEFKDLGPQIQKAMLPGFTQALKDAKPLVKVVKDNMVDLGDAFGDAAKDFGRLMKDSGFKKDFSATLKLGSGFVRDMTKSMVPLTKSIFDFGAKSKPTLRAFSEGMSGIMSKGIPDFFRGLEKGIDGSAEMFDGLFDSIEMILGAVGRLSGSVANTFGPVVGAIFRKVGELFEAVDLLLRPAIDALAPVFDSVAEAMGQTDGMISGLAEGLGKVLGGAARVLAVPLKNIVDLFIIAAPVVKDLAKAIIGPLVDSFFAVTGAKDGMDSVSQTLADWSNWAKDNRFAIQAAFYDIAGSIMDMVITVVDNLPQIYSAFKTVVNSCLLVLQILVAGAVAAVGWIPGIGDKVRKAAGDFDRFKDRVGDAMDSAGESVQEFSDEATPRLRNNRLTLDIKQYESQILSARQQLSDKNLPREKRIQLNANINDLANKIREGKQLMNSINGMRATTVITTVMRRVEETVQKPMWKATGGIVGSGSISRAATGGIRSNRVLVGEQGPEIVDLAPGSRVRPAGETSRMLGSGGGGQAAQPMHITLQIGSKVLGDVLIDPLRGAVRSRGGNVQAVLGR